MTNDIPGAAYDNKIYAKYSKSTIEKKQQNKEEFCEEFGLRFDKRRMLLGIIIEFTEKNNANLLANILPGLETLGVDIVLRAVGSEKFQGIIEHFAQNNSQHVIILPDENENMRKILAASDACFFFSAEREIEKYIHASLAYGSLPIAPEKLEHIVEDYNPNQESGTGFLFDEENSWSAFAALVRARESFRFPYDWRVIQKTAIGN